MSICSPAATDLSILQADTRQCRQWMRAALNPKEGEA
jgi:hypothetical protein